MNEKKQAFNAYKVQKQKEEKEEQRLKAKKAKEDFEEFLMNNDRITSTLKHYRYFMNSGSLLKFRPRIKLSMDLFFR